MKRNLYILSLMIFLFGTGDIYAQQLGQFSQYLHNPIILNPATAGVNGNINLKLSYRNQWTGFTNAPRTYYISVDAALVRPQKGSSLRMSRPGFTEVRRGQKTLNHGVGGYMISDTYGAFTNTAGYLTYAAHLNLTNTVKISLGLSAGMSAWRMNIDNIGVADPNDETYDYMISDGLKKSFFDMNSGIWVYSQRFYIGYSSAQLLQNQIRDIGIPAEAKANVHHFLTGGYKFMLNDDFSITPSVMFKKMLPAPSSLDFNVKVNYKNQVWGGLSYRTSDAVVIIAGYNIIEKINVSYSYDATLSELSNYSSGSHEVVIGFKVYKETKKSSVSFL